MPAEEPLSPGHRACQGCGEILALRQVMKALGNNVVVVSATGCMEIVTSPYPQSAWRVPWLHVAFENASAVVSGVESAYKAMRRKGKIAESDDPVFLAYGGDGSTADIGLQSLSGALERGHNFVYVCLDNEAYMNTGIQRSSSTPYGAMTTTSPPGKKSIGQSTQKKNMPAIVAAHGIPYVATASPAFPVDLMNKVKRAASTPGPAYIHIYSPCPTGWRCSPEQSVEAARMAVLSKVFPLYEIIDGKWILSRAEKPPCDVACPSGINVQEFVELIAKGDLDEAIKVIKQDNPLPAICGRVCHHPCELACNRTQTDGAVGIEFLKRFVADMDLGKKEPYLPAKKAPKGKKVAIVGGGPGGITAAYYLAVEGYDVTIFEAMQKLGGWLVYGIPEFRLPRNTLEAEMNAVRKLGVEVRTGVKLGKDFTLESLRKDGYRAIFVAVGTQGSLRLNVPGDGLEGVYAGGDFLKQANMGGAVPAIGRRVAIVGGGNVAMDSARTALRLGADEVWVLYRRSREEMPAGMEEVEESEEERIHFEYLTAPVEVLGDGKVNNVRCIRMRLGEPDESGRRAPVPIAGSEFVIPVDSVISAIGLNVESGLFDADPEDLRPGTTSRGTLAVDPVTYATSVQGIFAAGDVVTGPATVVDAIGAAKEVAVSIDRYLSRKDLAAGRTKQGEPPVLSPAAVKGGRHKAGKLPPEERRRTQDEVQIGFTRDQAFEEASACLHCGVGDKVTVAEYLKSQRRFRHLTKGDIEKIEAKVESDYQALLARCGLATVR